LQRVARVIPESNLLQLDREFDFLVPEGVALAFGSRVAFKLGRAKKKYTGFVGDLIATSEHATAPIDAVLGEPVLTAEVLDLAKKVAARQCVALGEVLSHAIPDYMPQIAKLDPLPPISKPDDAVLNAAVGELETALGGAPESLTGAGAAYLSALRPIQFRERSMPDWALIFAHHAIDALGRGLGSILVAPEAEEVALLEQLLADLGVSAAVVNYQQPKKAERFRRFQQILTSPAIVIGARSALYAPVVNLGFLALFDDLDESLSDQSAPYLHARELALLRSVPTLFAANYRSPDLQRLVRLGYLTDQRHSSKPPAIAFTNPGTRLDSAAYRLLRESLADGPMLVLLPNRGESPAAYCADCSTRLSCNSCGGLIWAPAAGQFSCRICGLEVASCQSCGAMKPRQGRAGSSRTAAELGRAFPGATVVEVSGGKRLKPMSNQIVVATPGSAPRTQVGYVAVVILDPEVWLARETLRAEQYAVRDWQEALALLSPTGRAVISGVGPRLGATLSLQLLVEHAETQLAELSALRLPPSTRLATLEGNRDVVVEAVEAAESAGAELIRMRGDQLCQAVLRFSYSVGPAVAQAIKPIALKAAPRAVGSSMRRGLKIAMDDQRAL
jgi:primosomal protein N' (replication factor Y)